MSSTISGQYSYLQAALLVLVIYYVGEFFLHGRGPFLLLKKNICTYFVFLNYNDWCWYFTKILYLLRVFIVLGLAHRHAVRVARTNVFEVTLTVGY